ncbi:MAG: ketosteroid isomerase-like protein [Saprospiraceae bacterium]|jgi:ketosteroid isomerase-like protein
MTEDSNEVTIAFLEAFADAWNRHDIEGLMSFMTADCLFETSGGEHERGTRCLGEEAVRAGYSKSWHDYPDAQWNNTHHFVQGNRGVSEWVFTGTNLAGKRSEVAGCDIFTFRDGKILIKNSYRKNRPLF